MNRYTYTVTVETDTAEHADIVMAERLSFDDDYGFRYTVDWLAARQLEQRAASCRCGGPSAWVETGDGAERMVGCICHHSPAVVVAPLRTGRHGEVPS